MPARGHGTRAERENDMNENEQPRPIQHGAYLIIWLDKFFCWCILTDRGDKVREPYWSTVNEARQAIDSGEAL